MDHADARVGVENMKLPGASVFAVLARHLDPAFVKAVVAPTIADLQHEAQSAEGNPWRKWLARARGYAAILRVLLCSGLFWRFPMRRLLTVVTLGCVGAAALLAMRAVTTVGPAQISPFFVMVVIAPLTLRYATLARTYRRLFFDCFGVGMIMSVIMVGWFVFVRYPAHASWRAFVPPLVFLSLWIAFGSALAAALASRPTSVRGSAYRRSVLDTVAGAITVAVCFGLIWLGGTDWVRTLSWAVFEGFFFLAVAVAIYLPILFVAKRVLRLRGRLPFALFGAFLFPIPLLALPFLQGRIEAEWHLLLHSPVLVVWAAVPYLLGGAIVGWLVAAQDGESARVGFS